MHSANGSGCTVEDIAFRICGGHGCPGNLFKVMDDLEQQSSIDLVDYYGKRTAKNAKHAKISASSMTGGSNWG
jgi:hypothetical protein